MEGRNGGTAEERPEKGHTHDLNSVKQKPHTVLYWYAAGGVEWLLNNVMS